MSDATSIANTRSVRLRWFSRGAAAVADQGLFAGANFLMNVCLARWLAPDSYGAFTVAFTIFLYVGIVHSSLIAEPMLVFGPGRYAKRQREYLGTMVAAHVGLTSIAAVLLLIAGGIAYALGVSEMAYALAALAMAQPCILFLWLVREVCYVKTMPQVAAAAGLGYMLMMIGGLYGLATHDMLSSVNALVVMGVASLLAAVWLMRAIAMGRKGMSPTRMRAVLRRHWRYGRWALGTALNRSVPGYLPLLILPLVLDLAASGSLKALLNLALPFIMASAAVTSLLVPTFVRARGSEEFRRSGRIALTLLTAGPLLCWLPLGLMHKPIMHLLYGGNYDHCSHLLWLVGLLPVFSTINSVLGSQLRAIERPDVLFYGSIAASVGAIVVGVPMMIGFGIGGMLCGLLVAYIGQVLTLWWFGRGLFVSDCEGNHVGNDQANEEESMDAPTISRRGRPWSRRTSGVMEGTAAVPR